MSRIPRPFLRRDQELALLEQQLRRTAERYAALAPNERFAFFWRNMTTMFRNQGKLLPANTEVQNRARHSDVHE